MNDSSIKSGTILGTIFTLLGIVGWTEVFKTIVLGGIGAVVSFLVSWTLRKLIKHVKQLVDERKKAPDINGKTQT